MAKTLEPDDVEMPKFDLMGIPGLGDFMPPSLPMVNPSRGLFGQMIATKKAKLRAEESKYRADSEEADLRALVARLDKIIAISTFSSKQTLAFKKHDHEYRVMLLEETKIQEEIKTIVYGNEELKNNVRISNLDYLVREKASREALDEPAENRIE